MVWGSRSRDGLQQPRSEAAARIQIKGRTQERQASTHVLAEVMEFRKGGQDGRRRRVLLEEAAHTPAEGADAENSTGRKGKAGKRYSDQALEVNRPRITCVLPVRWYWLLLALSLPLQGIAALQAMHWRLIASAEGPAAPWMLPWDVSTRGSLANWMGSLLLLLAAGTSLLVLSLRRHRLDDYRGGYRLWGWVSAACLLGSIDATCGLHVSLDHLLGSVLQFPPGIGRPGSWSAVCVLLFSWSLVKFVLEAGRSRLARVFLITSIASYGVVMVLLMEWWTPPVASLRPVVASAAELLGHWSILATLVSYGRLVHLDAQGQLGKAKRKKPRATKAEVKDAASGGKDTPAKDASSKESPAKETPAKSGRTIRVDGAHATPAPKASATIRAGGEGAETEASIEEEDGSEANAPRLSKAERKKLRR